MPWPGAPFAGLLFLLVATVGPPGVFCEGNVGCLFSERLCLEDEWCYDDFAFGRCLQSNGDIDDDDLFRYNLEREVLHQLSRELRRLFALGYRWSHGYTQCRLQAMLYATKNDIAFENNACSHLVDQDLEGALKALEGQDLLEPQEVAIVKYTPSVENPHADFADEVYYPPADEERQQTLREKILDSDAIDLDMEDPYAQFEVMKRAWIPQMHRRAAPQQYFDEIYGEQEEGSQVPEYDDLGERNLLYKLLGGVDEYDFEKFTRLLQDLEDRDEEKGRFAFSYNTPEGFRNGWELRDEDVPESRIYFDENDDGESEYGSGLSSSNGEIFRELKNKQKEEEEERAQSQGGIYTEGGVVYAPQDKQLDMLNNNLNNILEEYNLGFKRPERLDVKKPGPPFDAQITDGKRAVPNSHKLYKESLANLQAQAKEAEPAVVDTDYVYVEFKNNVYTWAQGNQIIGNISHLLKLEPTAFSNGRVDRNEVTFKVEPNSRKLNATQVAEQIDSIRDKLKDITGIEITAAGIGDRSKMKAIFAPPAYDTEFYIIIFTVCAVLVSLIVAAFLLILIKRHLKANEKLQGLSRPDTEASKDYQDLCRARMASKGQTSESVHGRITSLSRESEQSPSSRSSTSSWSEEPALHNMDISTGHMVLTYMEDHLKNKDRLEQEWVALCAYVAEPCETSIALRPENAQKNRYSDVVPYDHSRVVLNSLSNANGSDYINASSITDHDPRNPAYIAAQGPLPHTAPDFWQLVWEQGAVVIVMLSRLTEGGAAMCHRYWPEEGSELYHIHEVHLVSEHIWCDDYLVRSFYLKNVRTGETRTVTQFHFLSWPEAGVPASTKALLEFRRKVNKSYRGRSCPIVVHCSDGAGRTGTYCLIDMVLSRMAKGAKEIDIAATLEHLRDQRVKMVATKQQFEFVLTAVAEEVHAILKALPPQPAPVPDKPEGKQ